MDDESVKGDQKNQPDYDTRDPEVPVVLHHPSTTPNAIHSDKETQRSDDYVRPALHWTWGRIRWIWKNIVVNERLWIVLSTIVIAVATTMYTYYARKQLRAIKDQFPEIQKSADAAKDAATTQTRAFYLEQRAWIVPSPRGAPTFIVGQEITTPLAILNTGKTPALSLNSDVGVWLFKKNELPEFVYKETSGHPVYKIRGGTIFPNEPDAPTSTISYAVVEHGKEFIHRKAKPVVLTKELNENLQFGDDLWIATLGQFTYNDVFGTPHWTHFCWVVTFPGTIAKPVQPGKQVCSNYNDIDNNDHQPATK